MQQHVDIKTKLKLPHKIADNNLSNKVLTQQPQGKPKDVEAKLNLCSEFKQ